MQWWDPRQYVRDVRSGNVGFTEVLRAAAFRTFLFVLHHGRGYRLKLDLYRRWQAWRGGTPFPYYRGELEKTPRATLDLQAGELVRVKSQAEILKTVNGRNRNHGLSFDAEMVRYCGQVFRVLARVERVIEERTGKMIPLSKDCIILDGVVCQSEYSDKRLFCPRKLYPFWREIWLERVTAEEVGALPRGATCMVATSGPCAGR
jgi:hypothetical protein